MSGISIATLARAIEQALPSESRETLRVSVEKIIGPPITIHQIDYAKGKIRDNPAKFKFTVGRVRPGGGLPGELRYFKMPVGPGRKLTPQEIDFLDDGVSSAVDTLVTMESRLSNDLSVAHGHLRAGSVHAVEVADLISDMKDLVRRAKRVQRQIKAWV